MALTSTINTLETVSVPLASSLVETHSTKQCKWQERSNDTVVLFRAEMPLSVSQCHSRQRPPCHSFMFTMQKLPSSKSYLTFSNSKLPPPSLKSFRQAFSTPACARDFWGAHSSLPLSHGTGTDSPWPVECHKSVSSLWSRVLTSLSQPFSVFNRHPLLHALQKQEHRSVKDSL